MKILLIVALLLSFNASAQMFDLIRTIKHDGYTSDTSTSFEDSFVSTGTMEISGSKITRIFHTCEYTICKDSTMNDEILEVHPSGQAALIFGDSGNLVTVTIISLNPTLIIMQEDVTKKTYRIDEYKQQ